MGRLTWPGCAAAGKLLHELVGVEMLVAGEDVIDEGQALLGHPHAAALEELDKAVARGEGDGDVAQGVVIDQP